MGNTPSIKSHMQNAERTGVFQLTKTGMDEIPSTLLKLKNLRSLDLSSNKIKIVPAFIGDFKQLKHLSLNNNRLNTLPSEIGNLSKLETLSLEGNNFTKLPDSLSGLTNLKSISLKDNKFTVFPTVLCGMKHLDHVDLSRNKLTEITDEIRDLQVSELNLNQNQISIIPSAVSECPRLKVLRLEENCLTLNTIPPQLLTDSQISLLAVDGNLFELKDFHNLEGYEKYMERFTATKKKIM